MRFFIVSLITLFLSTTTYADYSAQTASYSTEYNFDYSIDDEVDPDCNDIADPFEKVNRKIFFFNSFLDYIILKPTTKAYEKFTNEYTRNKIGNFVDNIYEPLTTVNYALQGDIHNVLSSFWKFVINSTIGIAGTYDMSSELKLDHKQQTFGSTLAHFGVSSGPYVQIPILGGTNLRDMWDLIAADSKLNPIKYAMSTDASTGYTSVRLVQKRHEIMPFTDYVSKNSTDPYAAIRSAMHQRRESTLNYPAGYKCGKKPAKQPI